MKLALPFISMLLCAVLGFPGQAQAWWSTDYTQRTRVTLNTSSQGLETKETLSGVVVPVRLHSGNFDFLNAQIDGSDIRVIAADDKTPLKFWVERFDASNELAVVWVQLPSLLPGTDRNVVHVYAGNAAAVAEQTHAAMHDATTLAVFNFAGQGDELARDATGSVVSDAPVSREPTGLIGAAARLDGRAIRWTSDRLKVRDGDPYSLSLWLKPDTVTGTLVKHGNLSVGLDAGKVQLQLGRTVLTGGELPISAWAHLAATIGNGRLTLYVDGAQAGQVDLPSAALGADETLALGGGINGLVDQVELAATVRSADWVRFAHAAQRADARLVLAVSETEAAVSAASDGGHGHFAILIDNLTVDAWVVIVILGMMFVIAAWVMWDKAILVGRTDKANQRFLEHFRESSDVLVVPLDESGNSSLARLYQAGLRELQKRDVGKAGAQPLSGASLDAVKAAVDADLIRESHTLNSKIVLLTIAISGGPFLGLLGTVVGVMITFAAIAAAGDVNVNAIAPGIAAALLATVAGLAVAIPALFGYNYLAARIKNISSDMSIFVDEFVTRVAEVHGAR